MSRTGIGFHAESDLLVVKAKYEHMCLRSYPLLCRVKQINQGVGALSCGSTGLQSLPLNNG